MKRNNNLKYVLFGVIGCFFVLLLVLSSSLAQTPVLDIHSDTVQYIPTEDYNGWDYYILPPVTSHQNVYYWGSSISWYSGEAEYSDVQTNGFGINSNPGLTRGSPVTESLLINDSRNSAHDFFSEQGYPRVVRIVTERNPVFEKIQTQPISLHMDYAFTFYAEYNTLYWGFLEATGPFFMDIIISDCDVTGELVFEKAYPENGYTNVGSIEKKMTYPIFPDTDGIQNFTLSLTSASLVTLVPHPWEFPDWLPTIDINTSFSGEFDQGTFWLVDKKTGEFSFPDNEMFSIRMFNLSLTENEYYKLFINFNMDSFSGCSSSTPYIFLVADYERISGSWNQNGYYFQANQDENATLVFFSPGESTGEYSIYFQNVNPIPLYDTQPLILNTNITVEYNIYYTFTIPDSMIRVNATGAFDYDFYLQGTKPEEWLYQANEGFIDTDWHFIPSGTYVVEITYIPTYQDEIQFNIIPVHNPGTFNVDENTIIAVELPLVMNYRNNVTVSTSDNVVNQSITYDYYYVGKYEELIPSYPGIVNWLGNHEVNGVWEAWLTNETTIGPQPEGFLPLRDYEIPILIIYPTSAINGTSDPIDTFTATITITTNVIMDQSDININFENSFDAFDYSANNYAGYYIPMPSISSTTSFLINDDFQTEAAHVYGIPLSLSPYRIYNITVYLIGNYSTFDSIITPDNYLNVTFDENTRIHAYGGNLRELEIFSTYSTGIVNATTTWKQYQTFLILTVSSTTYLFMDVERNGPDPYYNATMQVSIQQLPITPMRFTFTDYEYNATPSSLEVFTEDLVVTQIEAPEMKKAKKASGFETILTIGSLATLVLIIRWKYRKQ